MVEVRAYKPHARRQEQNTVMCVTLGVYQPLQVGRGPLMLLAILLDGGIDQKLQRSTSPFSKCRCAPHTTSTYERSAGERAKMVVTCIMNRAKKKNTWSQKQEHTVDNPPQNKLNAHTHFVSRTVLHSISKQRRNTYTNLLHLRESRFVQPSLDSASLSPSQKK